MSAENYIKEQLASGKSEVEIAAELRKTGWEQAQIDNALAHARFRPKPTPIGDFFSNFKVPLIGFGLIVFIGVVLLAFFGPNANNNNDNKPASITPGTATFSSADISRRDTSRRIDVARIIAAAETYAANNRGEYPSLFLGDVDAIIDQNNLIDPLSGLTYTAVSFKPGVGEIRYATSNQCSLETSETGETRTTFERRHIVVMTQLESGAFYCQDNS